MAVLVFYSLFFVLCFGGTHAVRCSPQEVVSCGDEAWLRESHFGVMVVELEELLQPIRSSWFCSYVAGSARALKKSFLYLWEQRRTLTKLPHSVAEALQRLYDTSYRVAPDLTTSFVDLWNRLHALTEAAQSIKEHSTELIQAVHDVARLSKGLLYIAWSLRGPVRWTSVLSTVLPAEEIKRLVSDVYDAWFAVRGPLPQSFVTQSRRKKKLLYILLGTCCGALAGVGVVGAYHCAHRKS